MVSRAMIVLTKVQVELGGLSTVFILSTHTFGFDTNFTFTFEIVLAVPCNSLAQERGRKKEGPEKDISY